MDSLSITQDEVQRAIEQSQPLVFRDEGMNAETSDRIIGILKMFLSGIGKERIHEHLSYCLRELIDNAVRANNKRLFFQEEHLDIQNPADYETGLPRFHDAMAIQGQLERYAELSKAQGRFVEVKFSVEPPVFNVMVSNNSVLLENEKKRIRSKISTAKLYESLDQVFDDIEDDSESAGFGLVMLIIILRKIGVPDRNFHFMQDENATRFLISIPLSLVTEEETELISETLAKEISTIPQFPKHILTIQEMLKNPSVDFQKVSQIIRKDPSLMMEVLRMANSAYYRRYNRIENSELAVSILGLRGLRFILQSFGARQALAGKYSSAMLDRLWEHSTEVADIVSALCKRFNIEEEVAEFTYVGGLLHDIGKIILEGRHPQTYKALAGICAHKHIPVNVVEDLIEGVNHALIGAKMAARWNIPERIVSIIRYYRTPLSAPEDVRLSAKIIYLAQILWSRLHEERSEVEVEENILREFQLTETDHLDSLTEYVRTRISKES
jgi:putative nucleotidyltransferase with HDIG domain